MDDKQILDLLWKRSERAIQALMSRFGALLNRICMNILGDPQDAQECVNDTYMAIWNAIPPKRPEPLSPFVCRTGKNIALNRLRSNTSQKRNSQYDLSLEELEPYLGITVVDDAVSAQQLGRLIDHFLESISSDNRVIFLRRYWFGDSIKDIARQMGKTENAVSVRLNRTREQLRAYLQKEGY